MSDINNPTDVVIAYGNTLRGDDAVGPLVAETVARWGLPGVVALSVAQLTPELSEVLSRVERAVFVDARRDAPEARLAVEPLELSMSSASGSTFSHRSDPRSILALAGVVFGACPRAWLITIPASELALGEGLSPTARRGMNDALECIKMILYEGRS